MIRTSARMSVPPPTRSKQLLLDGAQQFGLVLQGDVVDVVQVEGAAFGQFETALPALFGAGEGALFVAVKLGLDELTGKQVAADLDEGTRPPG